MKKDPKKIIMKKLEQIRELIADIDFEVDQGFYNLEHAKERLEADLKQGYYFDGKNSYEIILKKDKRTTKLKKVKDA